jgi:hypothetical protein
MARLSTKLGTGGGSGIGGSGTAEQIAMFTAAGVIGDSPLSYIGGSGLTAEATTFVEGRLHVSVDLNEPPPPSAAQDPALIIITRGTNCIAHDGGVQSFNQAHYNLDVGNGGVVSAIAQAGLFANTATYTGGGTLINTAVAASATGGTVNYSFQGTAGTLRNNDDFMLGTPGTFGEGTAPVGNAVKFYCDVEIDSGQTVSIGNNVTNFLVPGIDTAGSPVEPQIGAGLSGGLAGQFLCANKLGSSAGLTVHADTDVNASATGGVIIYRGSTANNGTWRADMRVGAGGGQIAAGDTANSLVVSAYGDGSVEFATNEVVRMRIRPDGVVEILGNMTVVGTVTAAAFTES